MKIFALATMAALLAAPGRADDATEARNKERVRRLYEEVWQKGNVDFAGEVFARGYVSNEPPRGTPPLSRPPEFDAQRLRQAFPDLRYEVQLLIAEGDFVAARWTVIGTRTGPAPIGGAPTRDRIQLSGVNIFRFGPDGKVVETWNHRDDLGYREQMARVPPPLRPAGASMPRP